MSNRSWIISLGGCLALAFSASAAASDNSCADCHGSPRLLVTNKKLYDYFQSWQLSAHADAGVTCSDCHGGHPDAKTKKAAHRGRSAKASSPNSAINFRNVPATCASCHEDILKGYQRSEHYAQLTAHADPSGPNCVTCHGSVNAGAIDVVTVEAVCKHCHGASNHPQAPGQARAALGRLRAIDRYTRYISVRGDPDATRAVLEKVAAKRAKLARTWHTFSVKEIDAETRALIETLREERKHVDARHDAGHDAGHDAQTKNAGRRR